ncbi:hypothetical protein [Pseudonocardia sp. WMMC193]|uniref:hypothetical protein n=1 Tax=Pseudonocardia sp. WMMC193 TaxID=2911965 RepID=UPI001F47AD4F|nr:hypothetical protein [Pseudonocardia sp. WMMC193]MCF7547288.1 hypothetical protein [Pseudonocardia sp. WMMC193]MCF7547383.1 hypothetical protein [Pseudonocardia sp. WMMC193]
MAGRTPRILTTAVADAEARVSHEIAEEDLLAGTSLGRYRALCGETIFPAALGESARAICAGCAAARLQPELPQIQDCSRAARRGIAGVLRECVGVARCALQTSVTTA